MPGEALVRPQSGETGDPVVGHEHEQLGQAH